MIMPDSTNNKCQAPGSRDRTTPGVDRVKPKIQVGPPPKKNKEFQNDPTLTLTLLDLVGGRGWIGRDYIINLLHLISVFITVLCVIFFVGFETK